MADSTVMQTAPRTAFWRNQAVRAVLYQIGALGLFFLAGLLIFRNTLANLDQRGISSGFGFLENEAGFDIAEVIAIPQLEGGFLWFVLALFAGLLVVYLLSRVQAAQGRIISDNVPMVLAVIAVVFVVPGAVLYFGYGSVRTETYTAESSYGLAILTGLFNTVKVSLIGCVLATVLGLIVGLARLSSNWLVSRVAGAYVETVRNIPLLLQLFFWYHAVLRTLPNVRNSFTLFDALFLNNRGVYTPNPQPTGAFPLFLLAIFIACVVVYFRARKARIVRDQTGEQLPVLYPALGLLVGLPALVWLVGGSPFAMDYPELQGFNFRGGMWLSPEFAAMLTGLVMYTASFIAEIVRSGIQAVSKGQREAAGALGLRGGQTMRLVILPQALRVIIPPLTSQYLNLTKNSSLGVAIAFSEMVSIAQGTTLNQTGQAIELIAITMAAYLAFSLLISLFMNWYNAKTTLVER